jgi:hypothetical protein
VHRFDVRIDKQETARLRFDGSTEGVALQVTISPTQRHFWWLNESPKVKEAERSSICHLMVNHRTLEYFMKVAREAGDPTFQVDCEDGSGLTFEYLEAIP